MASAKYLTKGALRGRPARWPCQCQLIGVAIRLIIEARLEGGEASETEATVVAVAERRDRSVAELGLTLAEGRAMLAEVQWVMVRVLDFILEPAPFVFLHREQRWCARELWHALSQGATDQQHCRVRGEPGNQPPYGEEAANALDG